MKTPDEQQSGEQYPMLQPFIELWSAYARQFSEISERVAAATEIRDPVAAAHEWRDRWLDALGRSNDAFMRTPYFLEMMRHQVDFATKCKEQFDNVTQESARNLGVPTANDISGLFERLQSFEDIIIRRLDKELLQRIDRMESGLSARMNGHLSERLDRIEKAIGQQTESGLIGRLEKLEQLIELQREELAERLDTLESRKSGKAPGAAKKSKKKAGAS